MPQELLDLLGVDVAVEQQRGAGVPQIIEADRRRQASALQQWLERADDVAVGQGRADAEGNTRS